MAAANTILMMKALERACREVSHIFMFRGDVISNLIACDSTASRYGALIPRIAFLLGWSGSKVRYELRKMVADGLVIECAPNRKGGMSRWWLIGLFQTLKNEHAAKENSDEPNDCNQ